jgi:hypothetical protein
MPMVSPSYGGHWLPCCGISKDGICVVVLVLRLSYPSVRESIGIYIVHPRLPYVGPIRKADTIPKVAFIDILRGNNNEHTSVC